jgi:hypothetical protein
MRLVIQCSVCGTILAVGTDVCGTCRASGIQNLRLLFECMKCFRLGLSPICEICSQPPSLDPETGKEENTASPVMASLEESKPEEKTPKTHVEEESHEAGIMEVGKASKGYVVEGASEFASSLDDLPIAELHEEEPGLDDKSDSLAEGK